MKSLNLRLEHFMVTVFGLDDLMVHHFELMSQKILNMRKEAGGGVVKGRMGHLNMQKLIFLSSSLASSGRSSISCVHLIIHKNELSKGEICIDNHAYGLLL